jgi:RND family efflux transporter MFP subunit
MNKIKYILILTYFFLSLSCQKTKEDETTTQAKATQKSTPISTAVTKQQAFLVQLHTNGTIRAQQQTQLYFKALGEIQDIKTANTATVQAGQVLAVLDNRQANVAILQAQDQVKKAGFMLNKLVIEYGGKDLDTGSVRPRFLESIKIQSGYYEAQTALKNAKIQYDNTFLKAPYAGVVANLKTKAHNQASPNEPFCTLLSNNNLAAEAFVLESELAMITKGQRAKIFQLAFPDKTYVGTVTEINPQVNQQGLVAIKVKVQHPEGLLLDGMNCRIVIEKALPNQLVIPKNAVVERSGRKVVFVYDNGLAKWHYVTVSHENENEVAISDGLKTGEAVITEGNLNLAHDAKVNSTKQ